MKPQTLISKIENYEEYKQIHKDMLQLLVHTIRKMCTEDLHKTPCEKLERVVYFFDSNYTDEEMHLEYNKIIIILSEIYIHEGIRLPEIIKNKNFKTLLEFDKILENYDENEEE